MNKRAIMLIGKLTFQMLMVVVVVGFGLLMLYKFMEAADPSSFVLSLYMMKVSLGIESMANSYGSQIDNGILYENSGSFGSEYDYRFYVQDHYFRSAETTKGRNQVRPFFANRYLEFDEYDITTSDNVSIKAIGNMIFLSNTTQSFSPLAYECPLVDFTNIAFLVEDATLAEMIRLQVPHVFSVALNDIEQQVKLLQDYQLIVIIKSYDASGAVVSTRSAGTYNYACSLAHALGTATSGVTIINRVKALYQYDTRYSGLYNSEVPTIFIEIGDINKVNFVAALREVPNDTQ